MAIKIRKKVEKVEGAESKKVLEPELLSEASEAVALPEMNDQFLQKSGSALAWVMDHRRLLIFVASVIVALSLGWIAFNYYQESSRTSKSSVLTAPLVTYSAYTAEEVKMIEAMRQAEFARRGISAEASDILRIQYSVPSEEARHKAIVRYLEEHLGELSGSPVESLGQLMQAGSLVQLNRMPDAAAAYERAAQAKAIDVQVFALFGQAEAEIQAERYDSALALYSRIAEMNGTYASIVALSQGRIYEMMDKKEEAIRAYSAVIRDFGQSADQREAMSRLQFLTADRSQLLPAAPQAEGSEAGASL